MYGFTDDVMAGVQRWRNPREVISSASTIFAQPAGVIVGVLAPVLALLMLAGGGGGRRR
jgi:hypothetical protein